MSHLIIAPYDTVYTPANGEYSSTWHKLNTPVEGGISLDGSNISRVFAPLYDCGFKADFESPLSAMPAELASELGNNPISDWKLILADLRGHGNGIIPLHVAKAGYQIHQNKDLFESFVAAAGTVLGQGNFEIATVGTLGAFSQFFVSIAIKGQENFTIGANDKHAQFFNLVSSHNGLVASANMLSVVRIVCMNTVQASIAQADNSGTYAKVKHTKNSLDLITPKAFAENLQTWLSTAEKFKALLNSFLAVPMTLDQFKSFAAGVFTNDGSDKLSTNSFNRIEEMQALFARGKGNSGVSLADGINAFTEYFTTGAGVGSESVSIAKRIASANFGRGNEWKLQAIECAATAEKLAETLKRGEVFYADKLAEK